MAGISSLGVGSGLDLRSLVDNLIQAEAQAPVRRLDSLEQRLTLDLSGYGLLSSALADFNASLTGLSDASKFQSRNVSSSAPASFTGTASGGAVPGTYSVEVNNVAVAQQLTSQVIEKSIGVSADPTADDIGGGTLSFTVDGATFNVVIADDQSTLHEIIGAVNGAPDNKGVIAKVVTTGGDSRVIFEASGVGTANTIAINVTDNDLLDDSLGLSQFEDDTFLLGMSLTDRVVETRAAEDAEVVFEGITITNDASNTFVGVATGVDLTVSATTSQPESLTVSLNKAGLSGLIKQFVDSFNALQTTLDELGFSDIETGEKGALVGESILRNIETQLRRGVFTQVEGQPAGLDYLSLAGIGFDDKGKLQVDQDRLDAALDSDFESVASLFSGENGVASVLEDQISGYLGSGGLLAQRTTSLNEQIADIGDERDNLAFRLEKLEARLVSRFSALDALVSQLNNTGEYLIQQLTNINSIVTKPATGSK